MYLKCDIKDYGFDNFLVREIILTKQNYDCTYLFISSRLLKIQNIYPEQVFDYLNHIVSHKKAKTLTSVTIARCFCHVAMEIKSHNENYSCHCFKRCISRILCSVLVERKQDKLLLLLNMNNYKTIPEETLCDSYSILR